MRSSSDEGLRERAGPVYIVKMHKKTLYMHEYCAIWVPEIYLDEDNKLINLSDGLKRAIKQFCASNSCNEKGAAIGC